MRSSREVPTGWTFSGVSQVSLPKTPTGIYLDRGKDREKEVIEERSRLDSRSLSRRPRGLRAKKRLPARVRRRSCDPREFRGSSTRKERREKLTSLTTSRAEPLNTAVQCLAYYEKHNDGREIYC